VDFPTLGSGVQHEPLLRTVVAQQQRDLAERRFDDVRRFAAMPAARRARFTTETGAEAEGLLIEKCRYGALVALDDGRVVALGFSRMIATVAPG
jgi:hypothetical protein